MLVQDVKGLGSLNWLDHSAGPKLISIAPATVEKEDKDEVRKKDPPDEKEDEKEKPQAWLLDPGDAEPKQLTNVPEGIANLKASPSGDAIAFTVDVKMDPKVSEIY